MEYSDSGTLQLVDCKSFKGLILFGVDYRVSAFKSNSVLMSIATISHWLAEGSKHSTNAIIYEIRARSKASISFRTVLFLAFERWPFLSHLDAQVSANNFIRCELCKKQHAEMHCNSRLDPRLKFKTWTGAAILERTDFAANQPHSDRPDTRRTDWEVKQKITEILIIAIYSILERPWPVERPI